MGLLGEQFPAHLRESFANTNLRPGCVIYFYCHFTTPHKYKYLVVACVDPELLVLVINSEIHEFIASRPHLMCCQVSVEKQHHPFLDHDSHANCVDAHDAICIEDVREKVISQTEKVVVGELNDNCIRDVISACDQSMNMTPRHKRQILESLREEINSRTAA